MKSTHRALLLIAALAGAQAAAQQPATPVEADRIVAVVNDEVITRSELSQRIAEVVKEAEQRKAVLPPRDQIEKKVLERMIVERAQLQLARETGLKVDDAQLDQALARIAQGNRMNIEQFRAALERDGIVWERFREDVRKEMTIQRLREREIDNRIVVSEAEIENYLARPPAQAAAGEEYRLAHILLRVPEQATPESVAVIRARARAALEEARRGVDFAKVAATYSDASDALTGADLGWRNSDRLPPLFTEVLATMKPGDVSPILRSPAGFHILKLTDRRGGTGQDRKIEQTHVRHILIRSGELLSEAEARHKLAQVKERLDHGEDFGELARLYSNDASAARGGDLGWIYPGDTVPEFERAMKELKPGEVSGPVATPFGLHLIQVLERRVDDASPERRRLTARAALRSRKADEAYEEWLRQLRDRAYVEMRLEEN
ncbi:MAG: peptidylprolyl isomerase [Rhodocyclaceae bacterium]